MARLRPFTYATADEAYHAFIDKSRRKPYICGIFGRDITDPYHHPSLPGTVAVIATRIEEDYPIEPWPEEEPSPQLSLF